MATDQQTRRDGIGSPTRRREDLPLITGDAEYTDDVEAPDALHAALHRSQHGHAVVESVDTEAAEAVDGVVAVFTADDVDPEETPGRIPATSQAPTDPPASLDHEVREPRRPMLAEGRVRYSGEPVAVVVAEDRYTANDALNEIDVSYETLEAVTDPVAAREPDAPQLHEDVPENVSISWELGDEEAVDEAFEAADNEIELDLRNQRLAPTALEPRTVLADFDDEAEKLAITMATQVPHDVRSMLAGALGFSDDQISVRAPDVGGGFGLKSKYYPGEVITSWCATQLDRPVKWQAKRSEEFSSAVHGRGHETTAALAVDDDGQFRGLRVHTDVDLGAYLSKVTPFIATGAYAQPLSNQYQFPAIHCRTVGSFTNKAPMDAYRGAGRPEAAHVVERLVHTAAKELEIEPTELRRRNFIPPEAFPYQTPIGIEYDSGEYERAFDRLLELVDYDSLRERQGELREENRYLGIGLGCFIETAGDPRGESGAVRVDESGGVTAHLGSADQGQGHRTTFAQLLSEKLGVAYDDVEINEGDTEGVENGVGTFGSRTAILAGTTLVECAEQIVDQARTVAAHHLEADPEDVTFDDGAFSIAGAPERSIPFEEVAALAHDPDALPEGAEPGLAAEGVGEADTTIPFGAHAVVVEVDPRSGEIDLQRYVGVDDCGVQLNPLLVEGQIHGGIAQGLGQALYEEVDYGSNGALLTDSFQNYAVPKAEDLPKFETDFTETPSPRNPLGVKGVAESGTIPSSVALVNAVVDALEPFGVEDIDMPVRPEKVWEAAGQREEGS